MKNLTLWIALAVVVVAGVWYVSKRGETSVPLGSAMPSMSGSVMPTAKPNASHTPVPTATAIHTAPPTPIMTATPTPTPTVSPTPGIIVQEHEAFTVNIQGFAFNPSPLTVKRGDIVIFKNMDSTTHTATALNKFFDSKNIAPGGQWTLATANIPPGTYEYQCVPHPSMRGTIIIE